MNVSKDTIITCSLQKKVIKLYDLNLNAISKTFINLRSAYLNSVQYRKNLNVIHVVFIFLRDLLNHPFNVTKPVKPYCQKVSTI